MRIRALAAIALMVPASVVTLAADDAAACEVRDVEHKGDVIAYDACEGQVWFTDERPGLGNLAETGLVNRPTWTPEAPTGSYQSGDGYGSFGSPAPYIADGSDESGSAIFEGTITGAIDTLSVTIHGSHFGYAGTSAPEVRQDPSWNFKLYVDDYAVIPAVLIEDVPSQAAPNAQGLDMYEFTFTNVDKGMARGGLDFGPDAEHTVRLVMAPNYVNTGAYMLWAYGTSEVDGNIVVNDQDLSEDAFVIKA